VYACSNCHDVIDGRSKPLYEVDIEKEKLRALEETQNKLVTKGLIKV
jgi:hypothetical protein